MESTALINKPQFPLVLSVLSTITVLDNKNKRQQTNLAAHRLSSCTDHCHSRQYRLKTWTRYGTSTIYIVTADSTVEDVESLWHVYNIHCHSRQYRLKTWNRYGTSTIYIVCLNALVLTCTYKPSFLMIPFTKLYIITVTEK